MNQILTEVFQEELPLRTTVGNLNDEVLIYHATQLRHDQGVSE